MYVHSQQRVRSSVKLTLYVLVHVYIPRCCCHSWRTHRAPPPQFQQVFLYHLLVLFTRHSLLVSTAAAAGRVHSGLHGGWRRPYERWHRAAAGDTQLVPSTCASHSVVSCWLCLVYCCLQHYMTTHKCIVHVYSCSSACEWLLQGLGVDTNATNSIESKYM